MDNNNVNNKDSSKVILLITLIVVVSILLIGFVFIAVLDFTHKSAKNYAPTTTRRTYEVKEEESSTTTTTLNIESLSTTTVSTTTSTKGENKTTSKTTKATKTTTKSSVTPTEEENNSVIPNNTYSVATTPTTFEDALDSWEWEIVRLINEERVRNGLNELLVAVDFRTMAETAATLYYTNGEADVKNYLINYSNLRMYSNLNITPTDLYTSTLNSTKVTTNPYLKYIGVGVILKNTGLDTYFYVVIYE